LEKGDNSTLTHLLAPMGVEKHHTPSPIKNNEPEKPLKQEAI